MSIWKHTIDADLFNKISQETMVSTLGIEFVEAGADYLRLKMPVDHRVKQPFGIMHGGASCVLAETAASIAAQFCVDPTTHQCVGIEINTSHVKAIRSGWVFATARPLHLGKTTQLWDIAIENESNQLISMTRFRVAVLEGGVSKGGTATG